MFIKKISFIYIIELLLFSYILSIYFLTYREGLNSISNILALLTIISIWINVLLKKKKLKLTNILAIQLIFIFICLCSIFVSINQNAVFIKVKTLFLIFLVMLSIINYLDSFDKIIRVLKYFTWSGFFVSIYILLISDFSNITRYGSELGNQNAIGMNIALSSIFCFYLLINKKVKYLLLFVVMVPTILLTGSRKSLLFIIINVILLVYFKNRNSLKNIIKFIIFSFITILLFSYMIFNIPIFYEIIGDRMESLFSFINGETVREGSINIRTNMTIVGFELFKKRPITGYGIDNYRFFYSGTYSHNNFIELMVGTGVFGVILFYLTHFIGIIDLFKMARNNSHNILCYTFIGIIISYIVVSPSLVYYDSKHFCYIMAIITSFCSIERFYKKGGCI